MEYPLSPTIDHMVVNPTSPLRDGPHVSPQVGRPTSPSIEDMCAFTLKGITPSNDQPGSAGKLDSLRVGKTFSSSKKAKSDKDSPLSTKAVVKCRKNLVFENGDNNVKHNAVSHGAADTKPRRKCRNEGMEMTKAILFDQTASPLRGGCRQKGRPPGRSRRPGRPPGRPRTVSLPSAIDFSENNLAIKKMKEITTSRNSSVTEASSPLDINENSDDSENLHTDANSNLTFIVSTVSIDCEGSESNNNEALESINTGTKVVESKAKRTYSHKVKKSTQGASGSKVNSENPVSVSLPLFTSNLELEVKSHSGSCDSVRNVGTKIVNSKQSLISEVELSKESSEVKPKRKYTRKTNKNPSLSNNSNTSNISFPDYSSDSKSKFAGRRSSCDSVSRKEKNEDLKNDSKQLIERKQKRKYTCKMRKNELAICIKASISDPKKKRQKVSKLETFRKALNRKKCLDDTWIDEMDTNGVKVDNKNERSHDSSAKEYDKHDIILQSDQRISPKETVVTDDVPLPNTCSSLDTISDNESDLDDDLPDILGSRKDANYDINTDDLIWMKYRSFPFWPAIVRKAYKKKHRIVKLSVLFLGEIEKCLGRSRVRVNFKKTKVLPFGGIGEDQHQRLKREGMNSTYSERFGEALDLAEGFLFQRAKGNNMTTLQYFSAEFAGIQPASSEDEDNEDEEVDRNTVPINNAEVLASVCFQSPLKNGEGQDEESAMDAVHVSPEFSQSTKASINRRLEKNAQLLDFIRLDATKETLFNICKGKIKCQRHSLFFKENRTQAENKELKTIRMGPIVDDEQENELFSILMNYMKELKGSEEFCKPQWTGYIQSVWLPESLILAMTKVRKYGRKRAEEMFSKGPRYFKEEFQQQHRELLRNVKNISEEDMEIYAQRQERANQMFSASDGIPK